MLKNLLAELVNQCLVTLGISSKPLICPVCKGCAKVLGAVDFNRSCEDRDGVVFEPSKKLVEYFLCDRCGYCFAPELQSWAEERFLLEIYNDEYVLVDPELSELRPTRVAQWIEDIFGSAKSQIEHLDYGGGAGTLSKILNAKGWNSNSFDPFFQESGQTESSRYHLVTAIEVFEHVPDPQQLVEDLIDRLRPDGVLFFSTLLSDSEQGDGSLLNWWYLAPRNGHISLFSTNSLAILFGQHGFKLVSLGSGAHMAYRRLPQWCLGVETLPRIC